MPDYQNSKIYKLISNETENIYIGSTTRRYLCNRLADHKSSYKRYNDGKDKSRCQSFELLKLGDVKIILLENYPCNNKDELASREQYWIDQNKSLCINKLNPGNKWTVEVKLEYNKNYQKEKSEQLMFKRNQIVVCSCGKNVKKGRMYEHRKSQYHISHTL